MLIFRRPTAFPCSRLTKSRAQRASCVTTVGENISSEFVFRTGAAPLRPGSLSIQYARAVGGTQSVTAGIDGSISATGISGSVDYQTGLVRVRFGFRVTAAGNEAEPWYAAEAVGSDGKIFKPDLRRLAISRVYDAALQGTGARVVEVREDKRRGLVARLSREGNVAEDQVRERLGQFTTPWDWA